MKRKRVWIAILTTASLVALLGVFAFQQFSSANAEQASAHRYRVCIKYKEAGDYNNFYRQRCGVKPGDPTKTHHLTPTVTIKPKPTKVVTPTQPAKPTPTQAATPTQPAKPTPTQPAQPTPTQPAQPTQQPPVTGTPAEQAAKAVFDAINKQRAGSGLPALQWNDKLVQSATKHNMAMASANSLSHQLPGEPGLGQRITDTGLRWSSVAENIGYGYGDPTKMALQLNQSMFDERPPNDGHRRNILSNNTLIGIAVYVDQNNKVWLTEDFGRP